MERFFHRTRRLFAVKKYKLAKREWRERANVFD